MAEQNGKVDSSIYAKYEGGTPEEWKSMAGGAEYIRYLKKADEEKRTNELSDIQKKDLAKLKEYESRTGEKGSSEEVDIVDEFAIDWSELKNPVAVAFYACYPKWFFVNSFYRNMKAYVDRERKTKSIFAIAADAQKKYEKHYGQVQAKTEEGKSSEGTTETKPPKKKALLIKLGDFFKKDNAKWLSDSSNSLSNDLGQEKKSEDERKKEEVETKPQLDESLIDKDSEMADD